MPLASSVQVVRSYLATAFPTARVVTETPADLADVLPVIRVSRIGGFDPVYTLDVATIDVDCYQIGSPAAYDLAEQIRSSLRLQAEGQLAGGGYITEVTTISAPKWVPYDNTNVRRISATYRIAIRSTP